MVVASSRVRCIVILTAWDKRYDTRGNLRPFPSMYIWGWRVRPGYLCQWIPYWKVVASPVNQTDRSQNLILFKQWSRYYYVLLILSFILSPLGSMPALLSLRATHFTTDQSAWLHRSFVRLSLSYPFRERKRKEDIEKRSKPHCRTTTVISRHCKLCSFDGCVNSLIHCKMGLMGICGWNFVLIIRYLIAAENIV